MSNASNRQSSEKSSLGHGPARKIELQQSSRTLKRPERASNGYTIFIFIKYIIHLKILILSTSKSPSLVDITV